MAKTGNYNTVRASAAAVALAIANSFADESGLNESREGTKSMKGKRNMIRTAAVAANAKIAAQAKSLSDESTVDKARQTQRWTPEVKETVFIFCSLFWFRVTKGVNSTYSFASNLIRRLNCCASSFPMDSPMANNGTLLPLIFQDAPPNNVARGGTLSTRWQLNARLALGRLKRTVFLLRIRRSLATNGPKSQSCCQGGQTMT